MFQFWYDESSSIFSDKCQNVLLRVGCEVGFYVDGGWRSGVLWMG